MRIDPGESAFEASEKILSIAVALSGSLVAIAISYRAMRIAQRQTDLAAEEQNIAVEQRQMEFRDRVRNLFEATEDLTMSILHRSFHSLDTKDDLAESAFEVVKLTRNNFFDSVRRIEELPDRYRLTTRWLNYFMEPENESVYNILSRRVTIEQKMFGVQNSGPKIDVSAQEVFSRVRAARPDSRTLLRIKGQLEVWEKHYTVEVFTSEVEKRLLAINNLKEEAIKAKSDRESMHRAREQPRIDFEKFKDISGQILSYYNVYNSSYITSSISPEEQKCLAKNRLAELLKKNGFEPSIYKSQEILEMTDVKKYIEDQQYRLKVAAEKAYEGYSALGGGDRKFENLADESLSDMNEFIKQASSNPRQFTQVALSGFRPSEVSVSGEVVSVDFFDRCFVYVLSEILFSGQSIYYREKNNKENVSFSYNFGLAFIVDVMRSYCGSRSLCLDTSAFGYTASKVMAQVKKYPNMYCAPLTYEINMTFNSEFPLSDHIGSLDSLHKEIERVPGGDSLLTEPYEINVIEHDDRLEISIRHQKAEKCRGNEDENPF